MTFTRYLLYFTHHLTYFTHHLSYITHLIFLNITYLDVIYAKYLDYRTGSGTRLKKIQLFIIDILSSENRKQTIIEEAAITEDADNITLDLETLAGIRNQGPSIT